MYSINSYTGADLPDKTLCLTYDDGPGQYTNEIARFLHHQKVPATFFVVGKYAYHYPEILNNLKEWGHLVGNHTYDHPDLPFYLSVNGDVQHQILRTDTIIKKYVSTDKIYFRSPYGKWSKEVADELNSNMLTAINHVGPVYWDVGGIDCHYWKSDLSVGEAVAKYLAEIREKNHGIIVMHDDIADMDEVKQKNNTLQLTKELIPLLKEQGYRFIRLDEIESVKKASDETALFTLRGSNGKYIALSKIDKYAINVDGKLNDPLTRIGVVDLGFGKVALKASNGLYLNSGGGLHHEIFANSNELNSYESFDLIPITSGKVTFRSASGRFLAMESKFGGKLLANAQYMRTGEQFTFKPVNMPVSKSVSVKSRIRQLRRQMLYIKSKIQAAK
ncbi:MAG: polysaccharide deacetylase family protein [Chitinophagaceae bacterium]